MNEFDKYSSDMVIPDKLWGDYLKKYKEQYKLKLQKDKIWSIIHKYGEIIPHSLKKGQLNCYCVYEKKSGERNLSNTLNSHKIWFEITQGGEKAFCFKFLEKDLPKLVDIIKINKKMVISEEKRSILRERALKYRFKSKPA